MFYHFLNKEFRLSLILILLFGLFLFWIDSISEWLISNYAGIPFNYAEPAHLKLVYLLLAVVFIGLTSAVVNNENLEPRNIRSNYVKWIFLMITLFLIGEIVHVWLISDALVNKESIMELEENIWIYYIADYLLILGFSIGGFLYIKPLIHQ